MYCSKRLRLIAVIIFMIGVMNTGPTVFARTLPSEIRVGLSFGKSAWATASFSGSTGLGLGADPTKHPLWTSIPNQRVTLVGDGFRLEVGRFATQSEAEQVLAKVKSVQVSGVIFHLPDGMWAVRVGQSASIEGLATLRSIASSKGFVPIKDLGGYRLELQESYASRAEAEKRVASLRTQGLSAYLAYQGIWRVWVGDSTVAQLDGLRASLEKALPGAKTTLVNPDIDRIVVLDQAGDTAMIYASQAPVRVAEGAVSQRADNFRVEVGPYTNLFAATHAQQQLGSMGYPAYLVKRPDNQSHSLWVGDGWELGNAQQVEKLIKGPDFKVQRLVGPYRLVSFASYPSQDAVWRKADQLRAKGLEATALYENGWRVAVGNEATAQERDALRTALATAAPLEPFTEREIDGGRMQAFDGSGNLLALLQVPDERNGALRLWATGDGAVYSEDNKERYPGVFELRRYYHGGLTVINRVGVEDYVAGVVAKEMYPSWPLEALKAQAVVARSYGTQKMGNVSLGQWGCDVDDTTLTQVYTGLDRAGLPNVQKAAKETAGQYAWYNGEIANTYFHADGGGHTENSENIWVATIPYIRGVAELFPSEAPNATWQRSMTGEEIRAALIRGGLKDIGAVTDILIERTGVSGTPTSLRVVGTAGEETLRPERPRILLGFPSNNFTVTKPGSSVSYFARGGDSSTVAISPPQATVVGSGGKLPLSVVAQPMIQGSDTVAGIVTGVSNKFVFNGRGYGHALGLSQWGAKAMADHEYTYIQILQHYYQGIVVK